jgi:hypothetical protein
MNRILSVLWLIFISTSIAFSTEFSPSNSGFVASLTIPINSNEPIHQSVRNTTVSGKQIVSFEYFQLPTTFVSVRFSNPIEIDTIGYSKIAKQDTSYSIIASGSLRSFPIATMMIQPFSYSGTGQKMIVYQKIDVTVDYSETLRLLTSADDYSKSIFQNVASYPYIPNKSIQQFSQESLPYSDGNSVKLLTSQDQIYSVSFREILKYNPDFKGKYINSIFLYHKNIPQAMSVMSTDEVIDENDEILFLGKRPFGEQEWIDKQRDQYAGNEAFFLTYEEKENPNKLKALDQNYSATNVAEVVEIEQIYEEYKEYFPGFLRFPSPRDDLSVYPSTRTPGEAQYTSLLSTVNPAVPATYEQSISFVPSKNTEDTLQIIASVIGLNDFHTVSTPQIRIEPNHKASFLGLRDTVRTEYSGQIEQLLPINLTNSNSQVGKNIFKVQSNLPESLLQFQGVSDWQAVNKFTVAGYVQPITFQPTFTFTPKFSNTAQTVTLSGFNHSKIAVLDSNDNALSLFEGNPGIQLLASATKNQITVTVNDSVYVTTQNFCVTTISKDSGNEQVQFFASLNQNQVASLLSNSSFEYVMISGKNSSLLESSIRSQLQIQDDNVSFGVVFQNQIVVQTSTNSFVANLSQFFNHTAGKKYSINLKIPASSQSKYVVSEIAPTSTIIVDSVAKFLLRDNQNSATYIVISHKNFISQAKELADFHAQEKKVQTKVIDVEQIYNEFSYGKKSPYAIRNFLQSTLDLWQKAPTYVTLMGDASSDPNKYISKSIKTDFVPTFGRPSSDYWYVFSDSTSFRANFFIGRIPVETVDDAVNYVSKVKQYAKTPNQQWLKTTQFITGGFNQSEVNFNINTSNQIAQIISDEVFCGQHKSVIRDLNRSDDGYYRDQADTIVRSLNDGVLMNLYLAHGSSDIFQIAGWEVEKLRNFGKYFFLFTGACQTGNFSNSENSCRNETYVVAKDKGSIISTGISGWGELRTESEIPKQMVANVLIDNDNTWGSIFFKSKSIEGRIPIPFDNEVTKVYSMTFHSLMQHTLLGDPFVSLPLSNTTDYVITDLQVKNSVLSTSDSTATLSGFIFNKGRNPLFPKEQIRIFITTTSGDFVQLDTISFTSQCSSIPFEKEIKFNKRAGNYSVVCRIQATNSKDPITNNIDSISFSVFNLGAIALDPSPYWNVEKNNPKFRFYVPSFSNENKITTTIYQFSDITKSDTTVIVSQNIFSDSDNYTVANNFVTWTPNIPLLSNNLYEFEVIIDRESEDATLPLHIPFYTTNSVHNTVEIDLGTSEFQNISNSTSLVKTPTSYSIPFSNIPVKLYSNGKYLNSEGKVVRYRQIVVNNQSSLLNETARLLSILTMKDSDTVPSKLFQDDFYQQPAGVNAHEKLRSFLDSIDNDTYIFLVVSDDNFSGFLNKEPTDYRSMDSLRALLRGFGSALIDSINQPGTSFAFIGKKGWLPGQAIESFSTSDDTITVETTLQIKGKNGEIVLPLFGPVSEVVDAKSVIKGRSKFDVDETFFMSENRSEFLLPSILTIDTLQILPTTDSTEILRFISSKIRIDATENSFDDSLVIDKYSVSFLPFTETSIFTELGSSTVMIGDSLALNHTIHNHNFRDSNSVYRLELSVRNQSNIEVYNTSKTIENVQPNTSTLVQMTIPTNNFTGSVQGISRVIPVNKREFFDFNNSYNFTIGTFEDTIKPKIVVLMDNKQVEAGSVVGIRPVVTVQIIDNSFLPITPSLQRIRINTKIYTETNSLDYSVNSYQTENGNVLEISFLADSLQFGESIVQIFAEDGSSNKDTAYFSVFREKNTTITDVQVFPNPISTDATFQFYYSGSELFAPCSISIFNSLGQLVSVQKERIQLGKSSFQLRLKDQFQNSLPIGTYYFTISLDDIFVLNQPFGTFVIIR